MLGYSQNSLVLRCIFDVLKQILTNRPPFPNLQSNPQFQRSVANYKGINLLALQAVTLVLKMYCPWIDWFPRGCRVGWDWACRDLLGIEKERSWIAVACKILSWSFHGSIKVHHTLWIVYISRIEIIVYENIKLYVLSVSAPKLYMKHVIADRLR